ncbi:MAG: ATP-binding protein [Holosporaceae bacterium]|jgi:predicted AAA+ superfamily ATPase|nr:ATP-binding protein [Holosporaceae bacterium]
MVERKAKNTILEMLINSHVVYVNGARQCGKSTLTLQIASLLNMEYVTLDDPSVYAAAKHDPVSFVQNIKSNVVLDEIQLAPEIFRSLKIFIDEQRRRNTNLKILLTGSANVMALPELSDALVGRMQLLTLYPFSLSEFKATHFIDKAFSANFELQEKHGGDDIVTQIKSATFPEVSLSLNAETTRWFDSYLTTLLMRDIKEIANIEKIADIPIMLKIFANRVGSLINESSMARDCNANLMTFRRYRAILENMFVINRVFPWYRNIGKRFVKSTKSYFTDTYMLCNILGIKLETMQKEAHHAFGHILENFVFTELLKNLSEQTQLFHFRTLDNKEVDFVLERSNGDVVGIEVKSSSTISANDFAGLKALKEAVGASFKCGIVLFSGKNTIPFGEKMFAVPVTGLG